jgi:hypothetical protein
VFAWYTSWLESRITTHMRNCLAAGRFEEASGRRILQKGKIESVYLNFSIFRYLFFNKSCICRNRLRVLGYK